MSTKNKSFGRTLADICNLEDYIKNSGFKGSYDKAKDIELGKIVTQDTASSFAESQERYAQLLNEVTYRAAVRVLNSYVMPKPTEKKMNRLIEIVDEKVTVKRPSILQTFKNILTGNLNSIVSTVVVPETTEERLKELNKIMKPSVN